MNDDSIDDAGLSGTVPKRPFGCTGVEVSTLCLGGASVVGIDSQTLLREALRHGIDCWEYNPFCGKAFGDYFCQHPGVRERVFLTAKARTYAPAILQQDLEAALADNQTQSIDFFAIHGVEDAGVLTDDVRAWAERAKGEGTIRFFGFCTHKRMDSCLASAAELGWIDGIQTFYNYRMLSVESMQTALRRCHEKGIGIFAVKSMGLCVESEDQLDGLPLSKRQLCSLLENQGISFEQAKLRAIGQSALVTSICSWMPNVSIMEANVRAVMDPHPLDPTSLALLSKYADGTGRFFCRRCGHCDARTAEGIPIFNVMESLMYARAYGARELAAKLFSQIPSALRSRMVEVDYSNAEAICPQRMPIAQLMAEAHSSFGG
jgi:predicted aldo/keto reductase-like oxidoreductase